jgi:amidase
MLPMYRFGTNSPASTMNNWKLKGADRKSNASGLAADYTNYDALGLAELIARKQITALELLHAVRSRVEALNPKINAFCHLFFDRAEAQIREGLPGGPFRGVPYALKDLGSLRISSSLAAQRQFT